MMDRKDDYIKKGYGRKQNLQPELIDLMENLRRFLVVNKAKNRESYIIGGLVTFDEEGVLIKDKNMLFGYGDKDVMLEVLEDLKKRVESEKEDEDGYVSI